MPPLCPTLLLVTLLLLVVTVTSLVLSSIYCRAGFSGGAAECPRHPRQLIRDMLSVVKRKPGGDGFAPPSDAETLVYAGEAVRLSKRYSRKVTPAMIRSMHGQVRSLAARNRASSSKGVVWSRYRKQSAPELARELDLPPMMVYKNMNRNTRGPREDAEKIDAGSGVNQRASQKRAFAYEDVVGGQLCGAGARFYTEEDLRKSGSRLTPDFLLKSPITVDGRSIHWMDAKNYIYYGNPLTLRGLVKQARKYTAAFGQGAMVFSGGVAEGAPPLGGALLVGADWVGRVRVS